MLVQSRRPDVHVDAYRDIHMHYIHGRIIVDLEDVLTAVERLIRFHEPAYFLTCVL